ncbi:hypothetical protein P5673_026830 [Acropora cervicornis]|uniref:Uncharacterized protein n=1 Tax=Acropora cervicornis TaxID=6130 RepID=A0AAD9Q0J0_ACRCE|nr:hypothetical protein P5673_026830 [Acropora cervicornis]
MTDQEGAEGHAPNPTEIRVLSVGKSLKIEPRWNLDQFLEEASQREDINQQVKDMKEDFKISKVEYQSKDLSKGGTWGRRRHLKKKPPRAPGKWDHKKGKEEKGKSCGYCGKIGAHPPG